MTDVKKMLKDYAEITEKALIGFLPKENEAPHDICEAVSYSLLAGGKRIRPALVMGFYTLCGGKEPKDVLPLACAEEMIHTYSLIHDDLPCMDNDLLRRGKPSCHAAFGEATALLAGDALLTLAFETATKCDADIISPDKTIKCISVLANAAGMCGMIAGQIRDLDAENRTISAEELTVLQYGKTCMMIIAAAKMGCIAAGASDEQIAAAEHYAHKIGQVFQMVDDVLDVTSDEETLGKPINSDAESHKNTFVTFYGIEKTLQMAKALTDEAVDALDIFGSNAKNLKDLAVMLLNRKS